MRDQLSRKDDQISQLNEVMQKQAVHIQMIDTGEQQIECKTFTKITNSKPC